MPYFNYVTSTGQLLGINQELEYGGNPPFDITETYIAVDIDTLEKDYVWEDSIRDFVPKT